MNIGNMIVFVSYSSANRQAVEALVVQLGALGCDVEYEVKFVGAPMTWRHIFNSISNCDLFVTAVTREMLLSSTCEIEYQYARLLNKNILAVLLQDLTTEDLPDMKVKGLVDLRTSTPEARAELGSAIAALPPPAPPPTMLTPSANWVTSLSDLRRRIENLALDAREQRAVLLNVREFLERRESFEVARSLLEILAVQKNVRPQILSEANAIRDELTRTRVSTRVARRRRTVVGAIVLSASVALIAVVFSLLFFRFRTNYNVELSLTRTANVVAASEIITQPSATLDAAVEGATEVLASMATLVPTEAASITPVITGIPPTNTASISVTPSSRGVSFLPTNTTTSNSRLQKVYIGLTVDENVLGLKVTDVGDVAKTADIQVGDYILAVDSKSVTTRQQFLNVMQTFSPESQVTFYIRRDQSISMVTFVLGIGDFTLSASTPN